MSAELRANPHPSPLAHPQTLKDIGPAQNANSRAAVLFKARIAAETGVHRLRGLIVDIFTFSLRLGSIAPNFTAETTKGPIDFHEFIGDKWVILFSHPEDYTPVCTTELASMAKLEPEFTKRGVKLIGLSANTIESHGGWINDISEIAGVDLNFPIIGDKSRQIAYTYDMIDHQDTTNVDSRGIAFTIRAVFIIDPKKTIRLIQSYPASTGRNSNELLRVVDSLQYGDKYRITTPINWLPGEDVIVHPSVKDEEAKKLFPEFRIVKPYLRFTPLAKQ